MPDKEAILRQLQNLLTENPQNFKVIEDRIDVNLQMKYVEMSRNLLDNVNTYLEKIDELYSEDISLDEKKQILVGLAGIENNVEAFRAIEKFHQTTADDELKGWAAMALRESQTMLEMSLLDEKQILISSGLGGKGSNLRFFVVFINKNDEFSEMQQKVVSNELEIGLHNHKSELETITFDGKFAKILLFMPLLTPIQDIMKDIVAECNIYGDFLSEKFLITNVKELSTEELIDLVNKKKNSIDENIDSIDSLIDINELKNKLNNTNN